MPSRIQDRIVGAEGFIRVDQRFRIEGAPDPWRETTSSQKNGWAANRATHGVGASGYFTFYSIGPAAAATAAAQREV